MLAATVCHVGSNSHAPAHCTVVCTPLADHRQWHAISHAIDIPPSLRGGVGFASHHRYNTVQHSNGGHRDQSPTSCRASLGKIRDMDGDVDPRPTTSDTAAVCTN